MSAQRVAGWTAVSAGLLLVIGVAVASVVPAVASGAGPTGVGPAAAMACAGAGTMGTSDGHMGGAGMMGTTNGHMGAGMMGSGHMAGGMMGSTTGGCPGAAPAGAAPIAGATEVRVRATNFAFTPTEIRLPKAEAANLALENPAATGTVHDLTVPGLGIHLVASPGQITTVGLRGLAAGRYDAYCAVPGHADLGMRGTVIVE